jgi:hypothetical protein
MISVEEGLLGELHAFIVLLFCDIPFTKRFS